MKFLKIYQLYLCFHALDINKNMSLIKKSFALSEDIVFECYILILKIDNIIQFWFKGADVAKFLDYKKPLNAISDNVAIFWRKKWEELMGSSARGTLDEPIKIPSNWQPHTIFISEPGLYALISRSKKPEAIKFQKWLYEDVLPSIRSTGKYDIGQHNGSSTSQQAIVWEKERAELMERYSKLQIDFLTTRVDHQTEVAQLRETWASQLALMKDRSVTKISRLQEQAIVYERELGRLRSHVNNSIVERAKNGLLAQHNITENDTFRESLKRLVDRVVPKSEPHKEHYNACYMYTKNGVTHYRLIRSQLVTIQKYERHMTTPSTSGPTKRIRLSEDWLSTAVEIFRMKSPNPISFWNSVRQRFPEVFYGVRFANGTSKTDIVYLTEEEVRLCYRKDLEIDNTIRRQGKGNVQTTYVSKFGKFAFIDEDDAVKRCFTAEDDTRGKTVSMLEIFRDEIQDEIIPSTDAIRDASGFTYINIVNYIQDNIIDDRIVEAKTPPPSPNKDCN